MGEPRWAKIGRDLVTHRLRTLLVVLSIAVGVFAILVVMGGRGMLQESFDANFVRSQPPNATLYTSGFDDSVVRRVESADGVRAAQGRRSAAMLYRAGDLREVEDAPAGATSANRPRGIDLVATRDWATSRVEIVYPERGVAWPPPPGEVVLERSASQIARLDKGDAITIETPEGDKRIVRIAGFAHDINSFPAMFVDRVQGYVSFKTLTDLGEPEEYNQLAVTFDKSALTRDQASSITQRITDDVLAPVGVRVLGTSVPQPGSHRLGDIFRAVSVLLLALGVMALLLSGMLVVNTVTALLTQQMRQIGVMKAVGGRSGQIMRMYLTLVAVYGLLAVAIGLPTGSYMAARFAEFANGLLNFGTPPSGPPGYTVALAVVVGLLVPLAVAYVPVRAGTRVSVVRALDPARGAGGRFGHGLIDRVLGRLRGLPRPVALALRNTFLHKGRLALTLATLSLASAVIMSVISVRSSMLMTVADMTGWWRYDVDVTFRQPVSAAAAERVAMRTPGVTDAESWAVTGVSVKGAGGSGSDTISLTGLPPDTTFVAPRMVSGRWLLPGDVDAVVINTDVVNEHGLAVGDSAEFDIRGVERQWRVVGIVKGRLGGQAAFAGLEDVTRALGRPGAAFRLVVRTSGHSDGFQKQTADRLESGLKDAGLPVEGIETTVASAQQLSSELGVLVTFLVIMAVILAVVGVMGLTGTMVINVLESTREIGVMRAVGASHWSIFQVFVTEGVAIGLMAWAIGALATWPLSRGLVELLQIAIRIPLTYSFSWEGIVGWLAFVTAISALASLLPAYRASQVSVRDAIAYE